MGVVVLLGVLGASELYLSVGAKRNVVKKAIGWITMHEIAFKANKRLLTY